VVGGPICEPARIYGTIPQVLDEAHAAGAAPQLDLAAAAGIGRDLWDEPCEEWVRIPLDVPEGKYVAIRVSGESMTPVFHTGDTVLVQIDPAAKTGTVILVRLPDGSYAIKQVGRTSPARLELISLNPAFPPFTVGRDERTVVGTVVLRWCPHETARTAA
jgi:phage repressor protein C with HTH and peptisase S24 domain